MFPCIHCYKVVSVWHLVFSRWFIFFSPLSTQSLKVNHLCGKVMCVFVLVVTIRPLWSRIKATWEFVTQERCSGMCEVRVYLTDTHMAEDKCISLHEQLSATNTAGVAGVKHLWPFLSGNAGMHARTHSPSHTNIHSQQKERKKSLTAARFLNSVLNLKPHFLSKTSQGVFKAIPRLFPQAHIWSPGMPDRVFHKSLGSLGWK